MFLEDLIKFVDTEKFKVLKGYITNNILWDFLNDIDIRKLLSETTNESDLKQKIREKFYEYIIKQKNKDFYFFISSVSICTFTDIATIIRDSTNIIKVQLKSSNSDTEVTVDILVKFSLLICKLINKYLLYFGILFMILLFPFIIPYLCHDQTESLQNIVGNPFFNVYNYTKTNGIIDKDLLLNIKKFFIPKQKGIF